MLGDDSNNADTGYRTLVDELGHCFGLPDLYLYEGKPNVWPMGAWDSMSTMQVSRGYSGWHRHKMGWLTESRKRYITPISGIAAKLTLTPLDSEDGVSLVVAALGFGEQWKLLVFQVVDPIAAGYEGVLVYMADSTIESGQGAMKGIPKEESYDYRHGNGYKAPFGVGDRMEYHVSDAGIVQLFVEQRCGNSYHIAISYKGLF